MKICGAGRKFGEMLENTGFFDEIHLGWGWRRGKIPGKFFLNFLVDMSENEGNHVCWRREIPTI